MENMIRRHLQSLKEHPLYCNAHKVLFIEANMSYITADQVAEWCREYQPTIIESKDPKNRGRAGVWTGEYEKEAYAFLTRTIVEEDRLYFAADMVGANPQRSIDNLLAQMRQYRMERHEPEDVAFGKYKFTFCGKTPGGEKDDQLLSWQILEYWSRLKREHPHFRDWAATLGYRLG